MNKLNFEKSNNYFLLIIEWVPLLIVLQFLWFISSLPLITIGTASRTVTHTIYLYQEKKETKLISLFWQEFRRNLTNDGKQDLLSSLYFLLLMIDSRIFQYLGGALGFSLMYASLFFLYLSALLFVYQAMIQLKKQKSVSHLSAFFLFFNQWKRALLHLIGTIVLLIVLVTIGPIYLFLAGISSFIFFQYLLFFDHHKKIQLNV